MKFLKRVAVVVDAGFSCASKFWIVQALPRPSGTPTAIQYCIDTNQLALDQIINGKRKSFREASMISINNVVRSRVKKERVDVREQRILSGMFVIDIYHS